MLCFPLYGISKLGKLLGQKVNQRLPDSEREEGMEVIA